MINEEAKAQLLRWEQAKVLGSLMVEMMLAQMAEQAQRAELQELRRVESEVNWQQEGF